MTKTLKNSFLQNTKPIVFVLILQSIACNTNSTTSFDADSSQASSVNDTMPVLQTPITDSSSIIKTPPVGDDNVIMPDTNKQKR